MKRLNKLRLRQLLVERLENRQMLAGDFSGREYLDVNNNGTYDAGDTAISGANVFLDLNNNDWRDSGEPQATSAADGTYTIVNPNVPDGTYAVRSTKSGTFRASNAYTATDRLFTTSLESGFYRLWELNPQTGDVLQLNLTSIQGNGPSEISYDGKRILLFESTFDYVYELASNGAVLDQRPLGELALPGGYQNIVDYGPVVIHGSIFSIRGTGEGLYLSEYDAETNQFTFRRPLTFDRPFETPPTAGQTAVPTATYASGVSVDGNSIILATADDRVITIDPQTGNAVFSVIATNVQSSDFARDAFGGEAYVAFTASIVLRMLRPVNMWLGTCRSRIALCMPMPPTTHGSSR